LDAAGSGFLISETGTENFPGVRSLSQAEVSTANGRSFPSAGSLGDQPALLVQSSGTTGKAKLFHVSHEENLHRYLRVTRQQGFTPEDRYLTVSAMYFQVCRSYFFCLLSNGSTLILAPNLSPASLVEFVNRRQITVLKLLPVNLLALLEFAMDKDDSMQFPNLRMMSSGSAHITHQQRLRARQKLTANFFEGYGANELANVAIASPADQDAYPESVGRIDDIVEAEIVDDDDQVLPTGEIGLIRLRCAGMISGYLDNSVMTARHFRDGWYYPGDIASINGERYLFLAGRADDVINNAGIKYYPIEVETVLLSHPEVAEAAVFSWPHDTAGQVTAAAIVARKKIPADDLRQFCRERLADYKTPYAVIFLKSLPKNGMGKVLKRQLRASLLAQAGKEAKPSSHN